MKRYSLVFIFLFCSIYGNAQDIRFGWSIGDVGFAYDIINKNSILSYSFLNINLIINNKINISSSIFKAQFTKNSVFSFLPLEIAYIPLQINDMLFLSFFGRGEWQFVQTNGLFINSSASFDNSRFYGAIGSRFFLDLSPNKLHYSLYSSLFFEYTTQDELKIGVSLDPAIVGSIITGITVGVLKGKADAIEQEQTKDSPFREDRQKRGR
jgi:hypothetical protein